MSKTAFIFPGQGAQKVGMAKDFYEKFDCSKEIFNSASEWLDMDMKALCFEENDKINLTEYTQPAMVTACLAMEAAVEEMGIHPDVTAGLSLGEYCAIKVAGAMGLKDALVTIKKRGELMENAVPPGMGSMAAVLGLGADKIEGVVNTIDGVSIANYNCPGQIVITGEAAAMEEAAEKLKEAGAKRVLTLNVSGPFHSAMLAEAGEKLAEELDKIEISALNMPYAANVTGGYVTDSAQIKGLLAKQICSSVKWQQDVETMIADGVDTFIEIGPGKTLAGFMRKIDRSVKVYNIKTAEDLEKVSAELRSMGND
ncbi:MAG: ACP S-malonyltransferase [Clostridiales bacterium]|nr:ACP S-malonyltransferase [Clostridiales bacterium]